MANFQGVSRRSALNCGYASFHPIPWFAWGRMEADALRVDDSLLKTVVFLGRADNGPFVPFGTGFICVELFSSDEGFQTLVTARHVIEKIKSKDIYVRLNTHSGVARVISLPRNAWYFHPDDRIDVAVCPSIIPKDEFDYLNFPVEAPEGSPLRGYALNDALIHNENIGVGDEVYTAGLFVGRIGEQRNIPIVRHGTIAAMPGEPIKTSYGSHEAFLIEARSIDGLSGSPVCVNMVARHAPRNGPLPMPYHAFLLAGMMLGYNEVLNPTDNIGIEGRSTMSDKRRRRVYAPLNTGIAVVLPIWKVIEAMRQPKIQQEREKEKNKKLDRGFVPTAVRDDEDSDENPRHKADFTRLLNAAAKKSPPAG